MLDRSKLRDIKEQLEEFENLLGVYNLGKDSFDFFKLTLKKRGESKQDIDNLEYLLFQADWKARDLSVRVKFLIGQIQSLKNGNLEAVQGVEESTLEKLLSFCGLTNDEMKEVNRLRSRIETISKEIADIDAMIKRLKSSIASQKGQIDKYSRELSELTGLSTVNLAKKSKQKDAEITLREFIGAGDLIIKIKNFDRACSGDLKYFTISSSNIRAIDERYIEYMERDKDGDDSYIICRRVRSNFSELGFIEAPTDYKFNINKFKQDLKRLKENKS